MFQNYIAIISFWSNNQGTKFKILILAGRLHESKMWTRDYWTFHEENFPFLWTINDLALTNHCLRGTTRTISLEIFLQMPMFNQFPDMKALVHWLSTTQSEQKQQMTSHALSRGIGLMEPSSKESRKRTYHYQRNTMKQLKRSANTWWHLN